QILTVGRLRRGNHWAREVLCFPAKPVAERKVVRNLPCILRKQSEVFVVNRRKSGLVKRLSLRRGSVLKEQEEGAAVECRADARREIISCISAPEDFIDCRLEKEGLSEPEGKRCGAVHGTNVRVRHACWINRVARPVLPRVGKVRFVQFSPRDCAEPVCVDR